MSFDQLKGNWKEFQGEARKRWGRLTDDDVESTHGDRMKFLGKLQERYGFAKNEAERRLDEWLSSMRRRKQAGAF